MAVYEFGNKSLHPHFQISCPEFPVDSLFCNRVQTNADYGILPTELELRFLETQDLRLTRWVLNHLPEQLNLTFTEFSVQNIPLYSWQGLFTATHFCPSFDSLDANHIVGSWLFRYLISL